MRRARAERGIMPEQDLGVNFPEYNDFLHGSNLSLDHVSKEQYQEYREGIAEQIAYIKDFLQETEGHLKRLHETWFDIKKSEARSATVSDAALNVFASQHDVANVFLKDTRSLLNDALDQKSLLPAFGRVLFVEDRVHDLLARVRLLKQIISNLYTLNAWQASPVNGAIFEHARMPGEKLDKALDNQYARFNVRKEEREAQLSKDLKKVFKIELSQEEGAANVSMRSETFLFNSAMGAIHTFFTYLHAVGVNGVHVERYIFQEGGYFETINVQKLLAEPMVSMVDFGDQSILQNFRDEMQPLVFFL